MMKKRLSILICLILLVQLCGCVLPEDERFINNTEPVPWTPTSPKAPAEPQPDAAPAKKTAAQIAGEMGREELIAQLFLVKCPGDGAAELLKEYDVGGIILYGQDTAGETPSSLRAEIQSYQDLVAVKLIIAVDEEGYPVNRVSIRKSFRSEPFPSVRDAYNRNGVQAVREQEREKSRLLRDLGINVNLGPICDLVTDSHALMADRSMNLTPIATSEVVAAMVKVMQDNGVGAVLKHFPGYGDSSGDTHTGKVMDEREKVQYQANDFMPFQAGIDAGVGAVMVSHLHATKLDPEYPASISRKIITEILRKELGFKGVVITDDMDQDVIGEYYNVNEACVQAILAGNDMILTGWSHAKFQAVYDAVYVDHRISEERLMESVVRIIQWKMDLGLL